MAYYEDLSRCDYFGVADPRLSAVGWLALDRAYTQGPVSPEFFSALVKLLANPWEPFTAAGYHKCEFCRFTGGPSRVVVVEAQVALGNANLFVPAEDAVYVAPSLIVHYVDAHRYAPPEAFQRAVQNCPPMRSIEYLKAIRLHDLHHLGVKGRKQAG